MDGNICSWLQFHSFSASILNLNLMSRRKCIGTSSMVFKQKSIFFFQESMSLDCLPANGLSFMNSKFLFVSVTK